MSTFRFSLFLFIVLNYFSSRAQIVVDSTDMPFIGKNYLVSYCDNFDHTQLSNTGSNYPWSYIHLNNYIQSKYSYYSIIDTSVPKIYKYAFNIFIPPVPNICRQGNYLPFLDPLNALTPDTVFDYFQDSANKLSYIGFEAYFSDQISHDLVPVPVLFNTPDVLYQFPLSYGKKYSSFSSFNTPSIISDYFYYASKRYRKSVVDGWGTLTTHYGTFQVIRLKSTIITQDTFYLATLPKGQAIQTTYYEYQWLGKNTGIPLLDVISRKDSNTETIISAIYQDSVRAPSSINPRTDINNQFSVFPNPFRDQFNILYTVSKPGNTTFELYNINGQHITSKSEVNSHTGSYQLNFNVPENTSQLYYLKITQNDRVKIVKLMRIK